MPIAVSPIPSALQVRLPLSLLLGLIACAPALGQAVRVLDRVPPVLVETAEVVERDISVGRTFVGTVHPARVSTVGTTVENRVVEMLVDEGDAVVEGQPLARLRSTLLEIELTAARTELEIRRQQLSELEKTLPEELRQAEARLRAAEALRDFAQTQLARAESLKATRAISEDEYQEKASAAEAAAQKAAENESALALLRLARDERLAQARLRVAAQDETVRGLEDSVAEHTIVAPFGGYVTKKHTEVGQWLGKGGPVAEIVELDTIEILIVVPEDLVASVELGMTARIEMDALPGRSWLAPVAAIVPRADERSRSFPAKVVLKNEPVPAAGAELGEAQSAGQAGAGGEPAAGRKPGRMLFQPGMFVKATLAAGPKGRVLLVPKDAVVLGEEQPLVYAVDPLPSDWTRAVAPAGGPGGGAAGKAGVPPAPRPNGVARRVSVALGAAVGEWIEVRPHRGPDDLKPGSKVVVGGNERIGESGRLLVVLDRSARPGGK